MDTHWRPVPWHRPQFTKKVRYLCGLFGHRVTRVAARDGFVEYACACGHSFLKRADAAGTIRHPLVCFFFAHRIVFLTRRAGYAEYVCRDCGHPFCFVADPGTAAVAQPEQLGVVAPCEPLVLLESGRVRRLRAQRPFGRDCRGWGKGNHQGESVRLRH